MFDMTQIYDYIIHLYYNFVNCKMIQFFTGVKEILLYNF